MRENVNLRFTKAKFRFKINEVKRIQTEDGEKLQIVGTKSEWCRGADFERSLREDFKNKVERKIEFCDGEPEVFSLGTIYVRKDGKAVYVFNEIGEEINGEESI